jgi:exodeoxyribonuclease VIII
LQPVRTDWPVVDDLPEEGKLDNTWCDRYELNEDGRSWKLISRPAGTGNNHQRGYDLISTSCERRTPDYI